MRQVTKLSKNVRWLAPYLRAAKGLVPTHRLKAIGGFTARPANDQIHVGWTLTDDMKSFRMLLALGFRERGRLFRYRLNDVLQTFAHELAHMVHWDHSPKHWALEARIAARFARVAKRLKVKDVTTCKRT
jgi:hypothetical protein